MHRPHAIPLALLLACSFDATGLGGAPAATTGDADATTTTTSAHTTEAQPTTTDAPTSTPVTLSTPTTSDPGTGGDATATGPQPRCGDGAVDGDEACDDGPDNGATRPCTPDCLVNICGDSYPLATTEACDDGNLIDNDECRNNCTVTPTCGNSKVNAGEQCDDGNEDDTDACILCQNATCGDGFVQRNVESCDDGSESATCNADCSWTKCGDTKLNMAAGEICDLGPQNGLYASGCGLSCEDMGTFCGDGLITAPDEKCDPAKPLENATCTDKCTMVSCDDDFGDCDPVFANGCETYLGNNKNHCGQCSKKCNLGCTNSNCY